MLEFLQSQNPLLLAIGIVLVAAAVVGAVGVLYKKALRPISKALLRATEAVEKIEFIHNEFTENGGSTTLKDVVQSINRRLVFNDARQRSFLRDYPSGVMEMDSEGYVNWVNRTLSRITGLTSVEFMGNGWLNAIEEADRKRVSTGWDAAKTQEREFSADASLIHRSGEYKLAHCVISPMTDDNNHIIGYLGIIEYTD